MSRTITRLHRALFGAAVAAALVVGASAAVSAPRADAECGNPNAACVVTVQCIEYCFPYGGRCSKLVGTGGCCVCNR